MRFFFFQAEDGIRDGRVTGVQTCALPISSGDHDTELTAPMAGSLMRRSMFVDLVSRIAISCEPSAYTMNANLLSSGDQSPAEFTKLMASKWGSLSCPPSFLMILPVVASPMYRSIVNRFRLEKNAKSFPSGLIVGARL